LLLLFLQKPLFSLVLIQKNKKTQNSEKKQKSNSPVMSTQQTKPHPSASLYVGDLAPYASLLLE
jgi:hypothetical protein